MKILLIFVLVIPVTPAFSQTDSAGAKNNIYVWATAGTTIGFADDFDPMLGGRLGINLCVKQRHLLQGRFYESTSLNNFPFGSPGANQLDHLWELSFLYGLRRFRHDYFAIVPSIGLSYGEAVIRKDLISKGSSRCFFCIFDEYSVERFNYIGLPVNMSFLLTSQLIGISADVYANIHRRPDYGISLNVHVGSIRDRVYSNRTQQ